MKASQYFLPTTKEDPSDAVVASHKLMIRAGIIRKLSSGLYSYLPLGTRSLKKAEAIIREEMDRAGAWEFELPILTPKEIWEESGRWDKMGKEMFRIKDRHTNEYCLGPTHEESFVSLLKPILRSYKDLPINVYQMHTKFRDEVRPRFGVIRSREFRMKDAYSFHSDDVSLDKTYQTMRSTYRRIFKRMGLETIPVQADSGSMGGSGSEEFMVPSPIGEETLLICNACNYSSNVEKTPVIPPTISQGLGDKSGKIPTPGKKSIEDVAKFLNIQPSETIKAVALKEGQRRILVFLPGNRELNEKKLSSLLGLVEPIPMEYNDAKDLDLVFGFIGPKSAYAKGLEVVYDKNIPLGKTFIVGGGEKDIHEYVNFQESFLKNHNVADVSSAIEGDLCPECNKTLSSTKGIEVGHIFKLGKKYTESMGVKVLDEKGKPLIPTMGCYGIGVNRCLATIIEQSNDDKGIAWPISLAPFEVCLVSISKSEEEIQQVNKIYEYLNGKGIDILWDDRDLGAGFKFKDSELIGFPIRITIGKSFFEKKELTLLDRATWKEDTILFESNEKLYTQLVAILDSMKKRVEP